MIKPGQPAPDLDIKLVNGQTWNLKDQKPERFTMIAFFRGFHCPACKSYISQFDALKSKYAELGVDLIAISMDTEERGRLAKSEWEINYIPIGYGLTIEQAKTWGLFFSNRIKDGEPDLFSEPGLFLIKQDNTIYYVNINSQPFGRPHLKGFVKSIQFIIDRNYPAR
ncbi:MAG: AhpC/TSA family protein, partial [Winogradskyella sp.]|nr:AhpC/TSA family protein [Winogradskyella sp.]